MAESMNYQLTMRRKPPKSDHGPDGRWTTCGLTATSDEEAKQKAIDMIATDYEIELVRLEPVPLDVPLQKKL